MLEQETEENFEPNLFPLQIKTGAQKPASRAALSPPLGPCSLQARWLCRLCNHVPRGSSSAQPGPVAPSQMCPRARAADGAEDR